MTIIMTTSYNNDVKNDDNSQNRNNLSYIYIYIYTYTMIKIIRIIVNDSIPKQYQW